MAEFDRGSVTNALGMPALFDQTESGELRCPVTAGYAECSLDAGHEGEHRGHVSHDRSRAYVVIDHQPTVSETP